MQQERKVLETLIIDTADLAGTQITMLNSKGEIQTALEDMAEA